MFDEGEDYDCVMVQIQKFYNYACAQQTIVCMDAIVLYKITSILFYDGISSIISLLALDYF